MAKYDLIPWVYHHRTGAVIGDRVVAGDDAKAAAKQAIRLIRESEGGVRAVDVVPQGASTAGSLMYCTSGDPRGISPGRRAHVDAVSARAHRLAFERRGGVSRTVRCNVISPAFKKAITKKKRRSKR